MKDKKSLSTSISNFLCKIQDAKEQKNLTIDKKQNAKFDLLFFLNEILKSALKNKNLNKQGFFNEINIYFNEAIKKSNKKIKYKFLEIKENFFRDYIITLFVCFEKEDLLQILTGWKKSDLANDSNLTIDEKELLLMTKRNFEEKQKIEKI